jgi:trehalose utilization protein
MSNPRILVWNENWHERNNPAAQAVYPEGIHGAIAAALREHGLSHVRTALQDEPEHGLTEEVLAETDVLVWWGHRKQREVADAVVDRVYRRALAGMGLVILHASQQSKIFLRLTGTRCTLTWREDGEKERLWVIAPEHPIAQGIGPYIELAKEEMYGEPFQIPAPEEIIFLSWFQGGEVFRSGFTFRRGLGRVFYFRPGHETFPTYHDPKIRRVLANGCRWAAPDVAIGELPVSHEQRPFEPLA